MSSIQNVITTTFRSGGNQGIAQLGQYGSQLGNIGRVINDNTRMSERFNNQWKAIGTTIRYALAGAAVFGITNAVRQLKDIQQQAGLISAIGTVPGAGGAATSLTGNTLSRLMGQLRQTAVDTVTPLGEINDAAINLLSTVQNVPTDQISPILTVIARGAKLAQISSEDATKAFTTMNVAFGRPTNLANISKMAQEFFILTKEAPGGVAAGQQIVGQLGQLAQVTRAAHGTPEDMFSLLLSTLRSGIPPSQAGRGLQYLIQTLAFPGQGTKESVNALRGVGITGTSTMTLQERLGAVFNHARQLGIKGNIKSITKLDDETLSDIAPEGDTSSSLGALGISGRGAEYLGQVFHRIHALRTALALQGQLDIGQVQTDFQSMTDASNGHVRDVDNLNKAWKKFADQSKLQEATIALSAMTNQVVTAFAPVLNLASSGILDVSKFMGRHPRATKVGAITGGAIAAALGVGRLGGIIGGGGRALVRMEAIRDATSGSNGQRGASPQNPLYVIVVGELFNSGNKQKIAGAGLAEQLLKKTAGEAEHDLPFAVLLRKQIARGVGRGAGAVGRGAASIGLRTGGFAVDEFGVVRLAPKIATKVASKAFVPLALASMAYDFFSDPGGGPTSFNRHTETYKMNLQKARRMIPGTQDLYGERKGVGLNGQAEIVLDLKIKQPDGSTTRKKVHVPMTQWQNGNVPSSRGQTGKP